MLALLVVPAAAQSKSLNLDVVAGTSVKLKRPQHAVIRLPDSALITASQGDPRDASRSIDLSAGDCHLGFRATATFSQIPVGAKLKRHALDFSNDLIGAIGIGQGELHNAQAKAGGKKIDAGYWAAVYSTTDDPGNLTYAARAIYQFSAGYKRIGRHRARRPPNRETLLEFRKGLPLHLDGQSCPQAERDAVAADFAKAAGSLQLTG